ncbi:cobalamin biosynthesis protein [Methanobacterium alcaliphilum]|uniref:cobalamin biosynthesis protein n=1 Tax=Methanobacterium alcaliphilum TaxID=392018 RepID=UPI00200A1147|nr:cobalamin biosynthesis protein [Methanobacterium alcaliphilum]
MIFSAVALDVVFGELPSALHPVVWMGNIINLFKTHLIKINHKISGFILTLIISLIFVLSTLLILNLTKNHIILTFTISTILLSSTFSIKFLIKSSQKIEDELQIDLDKTRKSVSYLVSRDTSNLTSEQLISATIESLSENITDSVASPLFFAFLFGLPGAMFYRVINTLDAMVGYKTKELMVIGWFPANIDDLLNYIPARITGLIVVLSAFLLKMNWRNSYRIMLRDARKPPSPNSGYSMAAVAGALDIKLEKINVYTIGDNINDLNIETINNAIKLTKTTISLYLIILSLIIFIIFQAMHMVSF